LFLPELFIRCGRTSCSGRSRPGLFSCIGESDGRKDAGPVNQAMILSKLGNKADKFDWIRLLAHYMRRAWSSRAKEALSTSHVHADHEYVHLLNSSTRATGLAYRSILSYKNKAWNNYHTIRLTHAPQAGSGSLFSHQTVVLPSRYHGLSHHRWVPPP